jgi:hypothetical protein
MGAVDISRTDINPRGQHLCALEGRGDGQHFKYLYGASCLRGTDRRSGDLACRLGDPNFLVQEICSFVNELVL